MNPEARRLTRELATSASQLGMPAHRARARRLLELLDEPEPRRFVPKPHRFRLNLANMLRNLRAGLEEITDLIKRGDIERLQEFCEDGQLGDGELATLDSMVEHLGELKTEADKGPDEGQYSALDFCDLYCIEATP